MNAEHADQNNFLSVFIRGNPRSSIFMPDEKIQTAIQNWLPRFLAQGVEYHDFVRTTARIATWDDWCREWRASGDAHFTRAQAAEKEKRAITAGEAYIAAALAYHFGKFLFQDHRDEYAAAQRASVDAYARGLKLLDRTAQRIEIPFENSNLIGILRSPLLLGEGLGVRSAPLRPCPLALLLPGLDSCKEEFFYWENVFLARGFATFSLDGPGQGQAAQLYIRADYERAVAATLDVLCQRADVDAKRIGVVGVSLGGYYAVRALAYEPRVRAAVEIAGPYEWGACWSNLNALTRAAFQYHSGARDETDAHNRAQKLSLADAARQITRPLLIIHGKQDKLIAWEHAQKIADAARGELVLYENGNHVCNNIPNLYRPRAADWLREQLLC
ncbi:MAG: alpha/beta fold hydrolase [Chloroflexi bacterium]|nr:alpha/beta fold hydrolase [Chloroflexota bacterium]